MMLRQIKEKTRKRKKPWILIHFGASWEDISSHHFTFVFTPFMLEPPAVEMMTSWKLPTCGLLNKCAVCSGRSVRDQQPDFPEDNATGIISSTCCPGISVRLYTVLHRGYKGGAEVFIPGSFPATGKPCYKTKHQLGCPASISVSRHLNKMEVPCLCYTV